MFWGLILKPGKKYSQTVEKAFHLSAANLDTSTVDSNEDIQVLLNSDGNVFLLCTLNKKLPQCQLDLNFAEGNAVSFSTKGPGTIHLTGYLIPDVEDDFADDEEVEDENNIFKKLTEMGGKAKGKKAAAAAQNDEDDDDDSDEEDESFNLENAAPDAEGSGEEEEEEDSDEEDDDEEEDDSDEEEVEEPTPKKAKVQEKAKQNGTTENGKGKENKKEKPQQQQQQNKSLPGGVQVTDLKVGTGPEARTGKSVVVYYEGRLKSNNKVFDSAKQGKGFKFGLGKGEVIKAWDVGVVGMKVGGKRKIICPPNMAYGAKGSPPVIPPNSTLVFDVELRNVH